MPFLKSYGSRILPVIFCAVFCANVLSGCASWQSSRRDSFAVPADKKIYVAPFVDFTKAHAGVTLMYALQSEIYHANAEKYAFSFDENTVVVDGTVLHFDERLEKGRYFLQAELEVELKDFSGKRIMALPAFRVEADFLTSKNKKKRLARREKAKSQMWAEAAQRILDWL